MILVALFFGCFRADPAFRYYLLCQWRADYRV